jgi:hypothetical protein
MTFFGFSLISSFCMGLAAVQGSMFKGGFSVIPGNEIASDAREPSCAFPGRV